MDPKVVHNGTDAIVESSALDFAGDMVSTEAKNAVNTGIVQDQSALALKATEADFGGKVLNSSAGAKAARMARLAKVGVSTAIGKDALSVSGAGLEDSGGEVGSDAMSSSADSVMQAALARRAHTLAVEAEASVEATGSASEAVEAVIEGTEAVNEVVSADAAVTTGTSARAQAMSALGEASAKKTASSATAAASAEAKNVIESAGQRTVSATRELAARESASAATTVAENAGSAIKSSIPSTLKTKGLSSNLVTKAVEKVKSPFIGKTAAGTAQAGTSATATGAAAASGVTASISAAISSAATGLVAPLLVLATAIGGIILIITVAMTMMAPIIEESEKPKGDGRAFAEVVLAEYDRGDASGNRYNDHIGNPHGTAWCSAFVWYCWCQAGLDKSLGCPTWPALANSWIVWAHNDSSKGSVLPYNSNYNPKPGDILVATQGDPFILDTWNSIHVGVCCSELENGRYICVEGNALTKSYVVPGQREWTHVFRPNFPILGALAEGVDFSMSESAFVKEWGARINQFFLRKNPTAPLNGHGEVFARAAYKGRMDPRWLPAVSWYESNSGIHVPYYAPYNCYGWGITDSGVKSVAYSDGYDQLIAFILENAGGRGNNWVGSKPLNQYTSLEELDAEYCTSSSDRIRDLKKDMLSI